MNTKIDGYKSLLTHITVAQNVQFHRDATKQIDSLASLELFGLTPLVNRLDRENTEFETLHNARANAKEARRESGTLRKLSDKANKSFDVLCQIVNGMLLMPFDNATKSALEQIASLLNAQIHKYWRK
jgi:hypothetical protein